MSAARPLQLQAYEDVAPGAPAIAFPGSTTFGVARWPTWSLTVGARYTLVPISDAAAEGLAADDLLLVLTAEGVRPVRVVRSRKAVAGEEDAPYEARVVDVRCEDGRQLTYAPGDLFEVEVPE